MSESVAALINWAFLFGLVAIIFFIWRFYSRLAQRYRKEKWFFGLLGSAFFSLVFT